MGSSRGILLCFLIGFVLLSITFDVSEATEFTVGGKNLWKIPSSANELNDWAQKERFKTGDVLVFKYDSKADSVLQVSEGDYKKCITTKPIKEFHDGNSKIPISKSGAFFFISGSSEHCQKGLKLEVKVLSHKHSSPPPSLPPKGSPVTVPPPALTPAESPKSDAAGSNVGFVSVFVMVAALVGFALA